MNQVSYWYHKAQVDYIQKYMALYASFNAWYRLTTNVANDREALNLLREGVTIWSGYVHGEAMQEIGIVMVQLAECTQRNPISHVTPHWNGEIQHRYDWPSLVEYWYRVRCLVMHGSEIDAQYVYLAYETLNIFMAEVIRRQQNDLLFTTP